MDIDRQIQNILNLEMIYSIFNLLDSSMQKSGPGSLFFRILPVFCPQKFREKKMFFR
jgi:hypothetical protein